MGSDNFIIHGEGDRRRQLEDFVGLIAGIDDDGKTPRFMPVNAQGIKTHVGPPKYDVYLTYYGGTNNIATATYKLGAKTIAVVTISYAGGGASDNDRLTSAIVT